MLPCCQAELACIEYGLFNAYSLEVRRWPARRLNTHPLQAPALASIVKYFQVAEWRQLAAVAALVRFAEDPQWLAVEWADGTPAATYVTPARCGEGARARGARTAVLDNAQPCLPAIR